MEGRLERYMEQAIAAAREAGTPYGALLIQPSTGQKVVVANSVKADRDPTAHAEVNAIREAARQGIALKGTWLFSTCEPCPMCAMAAIWSGVAFICYGATIADAAEYGHQLHLPCSDLAAKAWYELKVEGPVLREACTGLFRMKFGKCSPKGETPT